MTDWIPLIILFTIFLTSFVLRILASKNLLNEYSEERSSVIFNTKRSMSINRNMFNKKGKVFYIASMTVMFLWILYVIGIIIYNFVLHN